MLAERQIGAAVRAGAVDEANAAECVAPQQQVLAEYTQRQHRVRGACALQFIEQRHRHPAMAQQCAAVGARAGAAEPVVLIGFHGGCRLSLRVPHSARQAVDPYPCRWLPIQSGLPEPLQPTMPPTA